MLKTILMSLALLAPPAIALASDGGETGGAVWVSEDGQTKVEVKGTVVATAGEEGEPHVVRFVGNSDGAEPQTVMIRSSGEGDGRSEVITSHLRKIESAAARADRGWLGVSISSSTTNGESSGVVVSSVVDGSPAEAAGVEAGDVIVAVGGEDVDGDTSRAIELISSKKPGDLVEVVVLRAGREVSLDVELGSRAEMGVARFNVEIPDAEIAEEIRARAHVMLRGDDGEWKLETLGDLEDMDMAFGELDLKALPELGSRSFRVFAHSDGERTVELNRDGTTLLITGSNADGITVTRVDENGEESTATYADKAELEANDAEAFEAFEGNRQHGVFTFSPDAGEMKFDLKIDPSDPDSNVFVWRNNMEEGLAEAEEAHAFAIQHLEEALEAAREGGAVEALELAERMGADNNARFGKLHFLGGKPKHTFEVQANGAIHVTIRRGENELVQIFADEADLANRSPNLYDKYADLMDLENE